MADRRVDLPYMVECLNEDLALAVSTEDFVVLVDLARAVRA